VRGQILDCRVWNDSLKIKRNIYKLKTILLTKCKILKQNKNKLIMEVFYLSFSLIQKKEFHIFIEFLAKFFYFFHQKKKSRSGGRKE
jgi:hypothetical protein